MKESDLQPRLVSEALVIRPTTPADFDALFEAAADPQIWALHPAHDRWQRPVFRKLFDEGLASGGMLTIVDAITDEVIGSSRYDRMRAGPGEIEIGWTFLVRSRWGGRTNTVMKRLMLAHALQLAERVIFVVGEDNVRSRRAMEKIGGVLTDRMVEATMAGRTVRHVVYAIDRDGFANGPLTTP